VDDHFNFQMATGALRLAARQRAAVFPCNIIDEGRWRFSVELGRPVPEKFLADTPDFVAAGKHLLDEMLPCFRAHPEQCSQMVFDSFQPAVANRTHA
jgi:lauroyl/myristoyl acyltransferase